MKKPVKCWDFWEETLDWGILEMKVKKTEALRTLKVPENTGAHIATVFSGTFSVLSAFSVLYLKFQDFTVKSLFPKVPTFYRFFHSKSPNFSVVLYFMLTSAFVTLTARQKAAEKYQHKIAYWRSWAFACFASLTREFGREFG